MIKECATLLDKEDWADIDLTLEQHGMPISSWGSDDKRSYVIQKIKDSSDADLGALHSFLTSESDNRGPGQTPFKGDRLRVFFSHLAAHRELVGETARYLARYGVDAFVAHDDIEPSKEWQDVIEASLSDCDAMVVFLHEGLQQSRWCDQEVGWAMGRRRPLLPLNFGLQPYGFMGKWQSHAVPQGNTGAQAVMSADAIAQWLSNTTSLHARLSSSLAYGFRHSASWDFTRKIAPLMERVQAYSDDDLNLLEEAAKSNVDVSQCDIWGTAGPEWVRQFVAARRTPVADDPWAATAVGWSPGQEPPF
ncbi:toll/interleukin-1 receptor domain-containing protein [Phycicoccus sp. SLBN-51]|uniref:toll/interleukin-1 receptor domain-containing protein n=1 Tax=Phycicoccus sp. SLBN-51 TaxID=2768447 RepID=UPI001150C9B5|nr:toll/interleukin-1 receptor domain-containing protein [Phycicoccus sp. SLBN-51]TQJ52238.1 TIR domain-containing protein [Phycicoccus sp. SLBN-51]